MDDIKVICTDEFEARHALKDLILSLRELGLSVNSKKTILTASTETEAVNRCLDSGSPDIERLGILWGTRAEKIIRRTFPELQHLTLSILQQGRVDSREFRFCMTRLSLLAACKEFAVPDAYFLPITDSVIDHISAFPAATDQFTKYLNVAPTTSQHLRSIWEYLSDHRKSFYTWQNYLLWLLLGHKGFVEADIADGASVIIGTGEDTATRAGATIYLGATGKKENREQIAERFSDLETFLGQRSAILAVHELPFQDKVAKYVKPTVRPDLANVYRYMREKQRGRYFEPQEDVSITRIIDTDRDYD